jgi:hypothetical protein
MPTLNELLLLGSRPKQLLLCLFAHRKRELSPTIISWYLLFNITFLNTATIKLFTFFFLGFNIVNCVLIKCPINSLPNKLALYLFLTIHLNIICIAITGNKILCLMSYVLLCQRRYFVVADIFSLPLFCRCRYFVNGASTATCRLLFRGTYCSVVPTVPWRLLFRGAYYTMASTVP